MHNCDCCCQYDYEVSMTHVGNCKSKKSDNSSPLNRQHSSDENRAKENRKQSNVFSIDAILSRPQKLEKRKSSVENIDLSPSFLHPKRSISPASYGLCCSSPKTHYSECRSPLCPSPSRASPLQRQECLTFYRRADLMRPLKEFHFDRRVVHEPTMVSIDKQTFAKGCMSCQDCKIEEIRRLRFGNSSIIPCNSDVMMQANHHDHDRDAKRNKRKRTIFTTEQLDRLEHEFQHQQYVVGQERKYLAVELGLNEIQVKVWFQNRRIKWRKQKGSRIQPVPVDIENF